jgi:hypothetical protein
LGRVLREHIRGGLLPFLDAAASGEAVDLQDVLKRFTFDNICSMAIGIESSGGRRNAAAQLGGGRRRGRWKAAGDATRAVWGGATRTVRSG